MGVKGQHIGDAHVLQLLQGKGTVQGFPVASAVLPASVEQGHNHVDSVGLTAGRLNQPLQVLEMVVGRHVVLLTEIIVGTAVVSHIYDEEQIISTHCGIDHSLSVA